MNDHIRAVLEQLSEEQINSVKDNVWITEYVFFDISVFSTGVRIELSFMDDLPEFKEDEWNRYDFYLEVEAVFNCIKELGLCSDE